MTTFHVPGIGTITLDSRPGQAGRTIHDVRGPGGRFLGIVHHIPGRRLPYLAQQTGIPDRTMPLYHAELDDAVQALAKAATKRGDSSVVTS